MRIDKGQQCVVRPLSTNEVEGVSAGSEANSGNSGKAYDGFNGDRPITSAGATKDQIKKFLDESRWKENVAGLETSTEDLAQFFFDYKTDGIDPAFALAQSTYETGSGSSERAKDCNNLFGINYNPKRNNQNGKCGNSDFAKYDSVRESIQIGRAHV